MLLNDSKRQKLALFFAVTLSVTFLSLSPLLQHWNALTKDHLWVVHLSLELFSIFVSVSIVAILFQRMDGVHSRLTNTVVLGFTTIALLDYIHALSYSGMPVFVTESSVEKAIFFWLSSRTVELLTMLAIAFRLKFQGHKVLWLCVALIVATITTYMGICHLDRFPLTFDPSSGVTKFKTDYEYVLFVGHSLLALTFLVHYKKTGLSQYLYFAGSCYAMALCALTLTNYVTASDFSLLVGHLFKILSAGFIYTAIYWTELKRPYQMAQRADAKMHEKDHELKGILSNIPVGIMRFDRHLNHLYINEFMRKLSPTFEISPVGKNLKDTVPESLFPLISANLQLAFEQKKSNFRYEYTYAHTQLLHREVIIVPEINQAGTIETVLCLVMDTTEKENAERKKMAALQETEMLHKALDEHAIVAFTDASGVITSVNKKFCEISKYRQDELIGQTHKLVNSGFHPSSFFKDLWRTIGSGKIWHGEVCNKTKDGQLYWVNSTIVPFLDDTGKPVQYIAIRADITERKLAEQEAQRLAYYDDLTSLPNRRLLKECIEKTCKQHDSDQQHTHALLLIDLDNFKDINDSLGHNAGDELLKQVALRLQQQTSLTQTAARLGGDEFVFLVTELQPSQPNKPIAVAELAEELRQLLAKPYLLDGQYVTVTPSIGVALFEGSEQDAADFLKQADIAMYQAKTQGRNQVSFYDPELQQAFEERNTILRELKLAISNDEFCLHYQPICDNHKLTLGTEALIRWNNKILGSVSPARFIPIAEQSILILDIGYWVLDKACQQLFLWSLDQCRSAWTVAVNVSARQLQQKDFVCQVKAALLKHRANPCRLKLEITESMLQVNVATTIEAMKELREMGVRFSLDDFGTGFSSLHYLTKLPIDTLKIDRSFVINMLNSKEDAAVVTTILSLATTLQLEVVAEGVETQEQFDFLLLSGCQSFQGYLLDKPMPPEQLRNGC